MPHRRDTNQTKWLQKVCSSYRHFCRISPVYQYHAKWLRDLSLQSCLTLWDTMDYSLPGSSVHEIFLARILEWVAKPSSRGSSHERIEPASPASPALQVDSLPLSHQGSPVTKTLHVKRDKYTWQMQTKRKQESQY